jgi:formylglycine-generating enzyme required for sulfatase activity
MLPIRTAHSLYGHAEEILARHGSFLCTAQYCSRYMVGTRGKGEGSTGTNHVGFRLVKIP